MLQVPYFKCLISSVLFQVPYFKCLISSVLFCFILLIIDIAIISLNNMSKVYEAIFNNQKEFIFKFLVNLLLLVL